MADFAQTCKIQQEATNFNQRWINPYLYTPINQTPVAQQVRAPRVQLQNQDIYTDTSNYSFSGVKTSATGLPQADEKNPNQRLKESELYNYVSAGANMASSAMKVFNAYRDVQDTKRYVKNVQKNIVQYESKKKLIDANIANQESSMMENLQENMSQLNVITAAQNVDISSEGVQAMKDKGLSDMSKDITEMRQQGKLNKMALDLDYIMSVKDAKNQMLQARRQFTDTATQFGIDAISSAAMMG